MTTLQALLSQVKGGMGEEMKETKKAETPEAATATLTQFGETLENITKSLGDLGEAVKTISERVAKIEGERVPTNSAEEDGGTDTPTNKSQDIWAGVL